MESAAVRILALLGLVPRRSTGSVLTCRASGGPKGGTVAFTFDDGSRLAKSGGSFPYKKFAEDTKAEMRIFSSGQSGVRKFQHQVTRYIDGRIFLDMKEIKP